MEFKSWLNSSNYTTRFRGVFFLKKKNNQANC